MSECRRQRLAMQRQRKQQQRSQQSARDGDHQRIDFADSDAYEQVGHAPEQAQRKKQDPAAL
jgi:hypothetical protein